VEGDEGAAHEGKAMTRREDEQPVPWPGARQHSRFREIAAFAVRVATEREAAAILCDEILQGPSAWWRQRLRKTPAANTAGMVQELLARMRTCLERSPVDAQAITELAVSLAEELDPAGYPQAHVPLVHAQALRDHAYVLCFRGEYPRALEVAERASARIPRVAGVACERARVSLVKALIFSYTGRGAQAFVLARQATTTFAQYGDLPRAANARMTEGIVAYMMGALEMALQILTGVENDPALDDLGAVRVAHNIGLCLAGLHRHAAAVPYLSRSIAEFDARGMTTERIRTQWVLGKSLLADGSTREAIPLLRRTSRDFVAMGLVVDGGVVALDLAEALLATDQHEEVPALCEELVEQFTRAGLAAKANTALSYLREARALNANAAQLVSEARASLRRLSAE
jgi:tetratricopeptide (TPR) repeat protein